MRCAAALAVSAWLLPTAAHAASILPGHYLLHNHPDGNEVPPPYGLRLDEMVDVTAGHDVFTFDFDHPSSHMVLMYNDIAQRITITGEAYGGRDIGGGYANDVYLGLYSINFVYDVGVQLAPGDDDLWTPTASFSNFGTITRPDNVVHDLSDKSDGTHTFRFGDEDDDNGHRGYNGLSGWGWLMVDTRYVPAMDFLFTAEYIAIPEPASFGLLAGGALLVGLRRGRRS
jgi:hypothetical protein